MAKVYQGVTIRGINNDAKYKLKYTLKQVVRNGVAKYTYSKTISTAKKYTYST